MDNKSLLIHLDYCLTPTMRINNAAIVVRDHRILAVGGYSAFVHPENFEVIDLPNCYATPGLIDTHISGAARFDCMHAPTNPSLDAMSLALAEHGVTAFLPTTHSSAHEHLLAVIEALNRHVHSDTLPGAVPIGLHVDGPFISQERRGAHLAKYVTDIDLGQVREILATGKGNIKILTYAPELEHAVELTEILRHANISPCLGHTAADQDQVMAAVEAGANRCLHLYNGMEPLQQRKVGLAAIALIDDRMWVEVIPDGIHSHWGMIELACRCKPKERLVCISNSTEAAGLADGCYHLGDRVIQVREGHVTLDDGTIAGSANFLDQNYRNLLAHTMLSQEEAVGCFTLNAATSIGVTDRARIKPGQRADLAIFNAAHEVQMTIVNGRIVFSRIEKHQPEAAAALAMPPTD